MITYKTDLHKNDEVLTRTGKKLELVKVRKTSSLGQIFTDENTAYYSKQCKVSEVLSHFLAPENQAIDRRQDA